MMERHKTVCPHGVSLDMEVQREYRDGAMHEKLSYTECLRCTEEMGAIVLLDRLDKQTKN